MLNRTTHAYSFHAGSVARLSNGNTLGAFVCDNALAGSNCTHMLYEVDSTGKEVSRFRIPALDSSTVDTGKAAQGYRGLPMDSIAGERRVQRAAYTKETGTAIVQAPIEQLPDLNFQTFE